MSNPNYIADLIRVQLFTGISFANTKREINTLYKTKTICKIF